MSAREVLADLASRSTPRGGTVRLSFEGSLAILRLDSPSARNAIDIGMMVQLADAVEALQAFEGSALILAANGPVFCSGGHLGDVRDGLVEHGAAMASAMTEVLDGLLALPLVSVAAVGGPAIGGGTEIALACDHRIIGPLGRFLFVQGKLGVAPGWGGARRLVAHVGRRLALKWLTSAADIGPEMALASGLAEAMSHDAERGAREFLAPVLALPVGSVRAIKQQVHAAVRADDTEARAFAAVWGGAAHRGSLTRGPKTG